MFKRVLFFLGLVLLSAVPLAAQGKFRISTKKLPPARVGVPYSQSLQAQGGKKPYTWSVQSGQLPEGVRLDSSSGVLSGTPLTSGGYTFVVAVQDSSKKTSAVEIKNPNTRDTNEESNSGDDSGSADSSEQQ